MLIETLRVVGATLLNKPAVDPKFAMMLCMGLWILWGFGYQTAWQFFRTAVDGTITVSSSRDVPRYATDYVIRSADGHEQYYTAGATDASLERGLRVGTHIQKARWSFSYYIDDHRVWFPIWFYGAFLLGAAVAVCVGAFKTVTALRATTPT